MDDEQLGQLEDAHRHLTAAIAAHEEGRHHAVRYRVGQARDLISQALARHPGYQEPTGATGAQTSGGQAPRYASGQDIAERLVASFHRAAMEARRR